MRRQWYHAAVDACRTGDNLERCADMLKEVRQIMKENADDPAVTRRAKILEQRIMKKTDLLFEALFLYKREEDTRCGRVEYR